MGPILRPFLAVMQLGAGLLLAQVALAQQPVLHERLPKEPGARPSAGAQELVMDPVGASSLPDAVRSDGEDVPAPALEEPDPDGDERELVYRAVEANETVAGAAQSVPTETAPDRRTEREGMLYYHAVFDPSVVPFKRNNAKDGILPDYSLTVRKSRVRELPVIGNRLDQGRDAFWGSLLVDLRPGQLVPIPSVAPESRILGYETAPGIELTFFEDGADNLFIRAEHDGRVRLTVLMDAPRAFFGRPVPTGITTSEAAAGYDGPRPSVPPLARAVAQDVWRAIGVRPDQPLDVTLPKLVGYFRSFAPGDPPDDSGDIYRDLALGRAGVCRHRVHAFVITAQSLGIMARYVSNEAHVFSEVWLPGPAPGWLRVDLGGGADGLTIFGGEDRRRHVPVADDPFPAGDGYEDTYSYQAVEGREGPAGATNVRGLPPRQRMTTGRGEAGTPDEGVVDPSLPELLDASPGGRRTATTLLLDAVDASVFRGEAVRVKGRVTGAGGGGVSGLQVVIFLVTPAGEAEPRKLGGTLTDGTGAFEEQVPVPKDLPTGTYRLVVQHMGDERHAPARAE